jgi:hypothetical protein
MNIEEIKDSLLKNNFTGLRVKLDTVIKFIDEQQAEIETFKQQLVTTSSEAKLNYNKGHAEGRKLAVVKELTDEEIHQAIRRGFSRDGFLSDGIFLEIKEVLRKAQEK